MIIFGKNPLLLIATIAVSFLWGWVLGKSMAAAASQVVAFLFGVAGFILFSSICIIILKINNYGKSPAKLFLIIGSYVALAVPPIFRMFGD